MNKLSDVKLLVSSLVKIKDSDLVRQKFEPFIGFVEDWDDSRSTKVFRPVIVTWYSEDEFHPTTLTVDLETGQASVLCSKTLYKYPDVVVIKSKSEKS